MQSEVLVTEIQRFAVNDGPGFRTNVFLKGCPLKCAWCHNPETIAPQKELYWKKRSCVQCGACLEACPSNAINAPIHPVEALREGSTYHKIIRERCDSCLKCVDACAYGALEPVGQAMSVSEILDEVERDGPFYDNSGGGLTISGGEPTAHADFALKLAREARERGIHICLDTNGYCQWEVLKPLAESVDIVLFDVKHLDSAKHAQMAGVGNELILENLARIVALDLEVWVRQPIIPHYNDSWQYHLRAAEFFAALPGKIHRIDLLPYHNWCQDKYSWLGLHWSLVETESMDPSLVELLAEAYQDKGFLATVGGSGFEEAVGEGSI